MEGGMKKSIVVQVLAAGLSLVAAVISFNLLAKHLGAAPGPAWFEAGCSGDEGTTADCAAVLASPYAYLPFGREEGPPAAQRTPVAFLGMMYYSALAVWLIAIGGPSYGRRWLHLLPLLLVGGGLAASAFFTYIMVARLDNWCPWCFVTHILNLLIGVALVLMWPRRSAPASTSQSPTEEGSAQIPRTVAAVSSGTSSACAAANPPYPGTRMLIVTLAAILFLAFGQAQLLGKAQLAIRTAAAVKGFDACMASVKQIKGDADRLYADWLATERHSISIRPDDPVRTAGPRGRPPQQVVAFSDFQCPSCRVVAEFLGNTAAGLFDGSLQVVYKHYPLHKSCNPQTRTTMHRRACRGARIAEAARILGGNAAFWRAHDYIYSNQDALIEGQLVPEDVAAHLGMDEKAFLNAVTTAVESPRIAEDAELAAACGVIATPAVFVDGRRVNKLAVGELGFWDKIADDYWKSLNLPRPASTELPVVQATASNQGP